VGRLAEGEAGSGVQTEGDAAQLDSFLHLLQTVSRQQGQTTEEFCEQLWLGFEEGYLHYDPNLPFDLGGVPEWCRVDFQCAPTPNEAAGMKDRGEWDPARYPMLRGMNEDFCAMKMLQRIMAYHGCDAALDGVDQ
jgi:hypothetical protein